MKNSAPDIVSAESNISFSRRLVRALGLVAATMMGLFFLLYFVLQIEVVQNFVLKRATDYFSEELNTTVTFDRIHLAFFDKLVLENFYAEDFHGDTLLFSEALTINLNTNLLQLVQQELKVEDLTLSNAKLYMRRYPNEDKDDFARLIDKLGGNRDKGNNTNKGNTRPFILDVNALHLENIEFIKEDSVGGENLHIALTSGDIYLDSIDLVEKLVHARSVELASPIVTLINYPKDPLPVDDLERMDSLIVKGVSDSLTKQVQLIVDKGDNLPKKWFFSMAAIALTDGVFIHHNYRKSPNKTMRNDQIDYNHLNVFDIQIVAADFTIQDWVFTGVPKQLSLKEDAGFILENLTAQQAKVTPRKIELYGLNLITPYSQLGDTLIMKFKKYSDFRDYPNQVYMDGKFDDAYIALRDIMAFAPALERNTFFAQNRNEILYIDGVLKGRVNNLKGRDLNLRLSKNLQLRGNFNSRNLTQSDETFLSLKLDRLRTNMFTLRQLIPNFNPPKNFDKLGRLDFEGRFDGFFNDFVADGLLKSDLGVASLDMNLNTREGREQAQYSGQLSLVDFDLRRWTDNPDFGLVTFNSKVYDGVGLTSNTADAKLQASIDHFEFKDYDYKNLNIAGAINQNLFIGDFGIEDENINFRFEGTINFEQNVPVFDFNADVKTVDLKDLNLTKEDMVLAGNIVLKIRGNNVNDLLGRATLYDFTLLKNQKEAYHIDSLKFTSAITHDRKKAWRVNSELFKASLIGNFQLTKIGESLLQYIEHNHPTYASRFNIRSKKDTTITNNEFALDFKIKNSKNFTRLLDKQLDTLKNIHLYTYFDYNKDTLTVDLEVPDFKYGQLTTEKAKLVLGGDKSLGKLDFSVLKTRIGKLNFDYVSLLSYIEDESVLFNFNTADLTNELDKLNLEGRLSLIGDQFNIRLLPGHLVILNTVWDIAADNYIQIGKDFIRTQNFEMTQGEQKVAINSLLDKGLLLNIEGFNANYIDAIWDYENLDFEGEYRLTLQAEDLFALENLKLNITADTFNINWDNYGTLTLDASAPNIKSPIDVRLTTQNGDRRMELKGFYNPPNVNIQPRILETSPNYVNVAVNIEEYPLHLAEYFVRSGISNTIGKIDAQLSLNGLLSDPNLDGTIRVYDGATTLDYTNTRYTIIDETVKMNNDYMLDATGGTFYDAEGNTAVITGGITHDFFSKLKLDCKVTSDHFLVLNTSKGDNALYYGRGIGKGDIYFSGNFDQTNIDIKATTARGTHISIPVSGESTIEETSFIRFEKIDTTALMKEKENTFSSELRGIKLHLQLEMTDAAEVLLIFDEQAGDIMRGRGNGNIKMDLTRSGDISMYGNYEIEEGEYLFTLLNVVNKPFTVKRGGTITWTGDPYNALINIDAEYKGLSTAPYNFVLEYLNENEIKSEARQATAVDLTMGLTGQLLTPNISFSLDFPNLTGELKNYTDNKIRSIELDQNELNTQVLGLIVFGTFLPSNQGALLAATQSQLAINTLSELLSNQLSIYLTELFSQGLSDISFLDLEDFNVNYNQYDAATIDNPNDLITGHELSINPKFRVKDRWIFNIAGKANLGGGSVVNNNADALVTGDFIIEYELTKDRRLKVRGYLKNEPEILGGRRNNAGIGLTFRKEFNNFDEIFSFMKRTKQVAASKAIKNDVGGN